MNRKTALRGRPVGSGVDDSDRLAKIIQLIEENPGMKPTTAIRAIGIEDESTIRRLRDKYNSNLECARKAPSSETVAAAARSMALRSACEPKRSEPQSMQSAACSSPAQSCSIATLPPDVVLPGKKLFAAFYSAGMTTAQLAIEMQFKALAWALQGSPAMCFLRSQELLDQMLAAGNDGRARTSIPIRH